MSSVKSERHNVEAFLYSFSRMLETASFYGFRVILILYLTGEVINMEESVAFSVFGWLALTMIFSQIFGALIGDLVLGNKKAILLGGLFHAMGAFILCFSSAKGLYIGLSLYLIGNGLFRPNIIANFGKMYLSKPKLVDSGFTLFYLAANTGSFLGILCIGYVGDEYGVNFGFAISGILMLLSIAPILMVKEISSSISISSKSKNGLCIKSIALIFFWVSIFWAIYGIADIRFLDLKLKFSQVSNFEWARSVWTSLDLFFYFPLCIFIIIMWTYRNNDQFLKVLLAFIFASISFVILYLIPDIPDHQNVFLFIFSLLFLSLSEIFIAPIVDSMLTKNVNPKYLAIAMSLAFIPTRVVAVLTGFFKGDLYDNPKLAILIGMIAMLVFSVGLFMPTRIKQIVLRVD